MPTERSRREPAVRRPSSRSARYVLRLYIAGATPQSTLALANLRRICETHLKNRYAIEVVDLYEEPLRAKRDQVVAVPALLKRLPPPVRRVIGDLSNTEQVLVGMDVNEV